MHHCITSLLKDHRIAALTACVPTPVLSQPAFQEQLQHYSKAKLKFTSKVNALAPRLDLILTSTPSLGRSGRAVTMFCNEENSAQSILFL